MEKDTYFIIKSNFNTYHLAFSGRNVQQMQNSNGNQYEPNPPFWVILKFVFSAAVKMGQIFLCNLPQSQQQFIFLFLNKN